MKKIRLILMSLLLCMTLCNAFSVKVQAAEVASGSCGENLTWVLDDAGQLTVSGTGDMYDYTKGQAPWYSSFSAEITSVVLEDGVTSVGNYAFENCSQITDVDMADSVTSIGSNAFAECHKMDTLNLSSSVNYIGEYAFNYCKKLKSVKIPSGVTELKQNAFGNCYELASVQLHSGLHTIGPWAFTATGMTHIAIPEGVISIGESAFSYTGPLKSVSLPDSLERIDEAAFVSCGLTTVTLPKGVTSIGPNPFSSCSSLSAIHVAADNTSYRSVDGVLYTYDYSTLLSYPAAKTGEYTIHEQTETIAQKAFSFCEKLETVTIPSSVINIRSNAFSSCSGLTSVTFNGDAPSCPGVNYAFQAAFKGVTATAYYPANNETWTDEAKSSFGGTLTWVAVEPEVPEDPPSEEEPDEVIKEDSIDITGTYVPDTTNATVYSVDISWSSMSFTYHDEQEPVWDAENHQYSEHADAYWEGAGTITITNHSNTEINATPSYAAATGYESADMTFSTAKLSVASAESGSAQTDTIVVTPTGSLPVETNGQVIGIITITLD